MMNILRRYGLYGAIRLAYSLLVSKCFLSGKIRVIRVPFYIRGARYIAWGKKFTSGVNLRIDADPEESLKGKNITVVKFGENVQVNDYVHIGAVRSIIIGDNVLIASNVFISDHNHGIYTGESQSHPQSSPSLRPIHSAPVLIGNNVWIGEHVSILPGVTIGSGSIIGANSVVSKSVPPNCIALGIPAVAIKKFDFLNNKWERV